MTLRAGLQSSDSAGFFASLWESCAAVASIFCRTMSELGAGLLTCVSVGGDVPICTPAAEKFVPIAVGMRVCMLSGAGIGAGVCAGICERRWVNAGVLEYIPGSDCGVASMRLSL